MNYKIVHVGGDPTKAAFLASDLSKEVRELQADGWEIDGVDPIEHEHGWDMGKQMYVKTQEYIIRAKKDDKAFHCGFEESGGHAYNCNDCPNKCEEWYQWDKEFKEAKNE